MTMIVLISFPVCSCIAFFIYLVQQKLRPCEYLYSLYAWENKEMPLAVSFWFICGVDLFSVHTQVSNSSFFPSQNGV